MANDAGGVVRPMGLLYPCQRGNTGQPGMSAFQVNGSPRAYIASSLRERTSTVHPHACGEHSFLIFEHHVNTGSSPRMWGTLLVSSGISIYLRFIPTHVGNTGLGSSAGCGGTVHPHACGEHLDTAPHPGRFLGSSPRMWGTRLGPPLHQLWTRFIPTHVGNTLTVQHCF